MHILASSSWTTSTRTPLELPTYVVQKSATRGYSSITERHLCTYILTNSLSSCLRWLPVDGSCCLDNIGNAHTSVTLSGPEKPKVSVHLTITIHHQVHREFFITLYKHRGKRKTRLCNGSDGLVTSLLHGGFVSIPGKACGIYGKPSGTGRGFSSSTSVSLSIWFHQCFILIFVYVLLLPAGQRGEVWEPSKQQSTLTLILLTWRIGWAPNNTRRWQMGFNSVFKGLKKGISG